MSTIGSMDPDALEKLLTDYPLDVEDSRLLSLIYTSLCKERKAGLAENTPLIEKIAVEEYNELSKRLFNSKVQDPSSVRNLLRARAIAHLLIDDEGELQTSILTDLITRIEKSLYFLGPEQEGDARRQEHILHFLRGLATDIELQKLLRRVEKPVSHKVAEQMIRDSLMLAPNTLITDAYARRAVLSALLCFLRQSVGSCFATAPAIIIQAEQPKQFMHDMIELLNTGRLKRTFEGVEYTVPLSYSWGAGDLKKRFCLYQKVEQSETKIWQSPGLINALQSVGLIPEDLSIGAKREKLKGFITQFLQNYPVTHPGEDAVIVTTCEELIESILLVSRDLLPSDVTDYLNRNQGMIYSSLLMQVSQGSLGKKGKGQRVQQYLHDLERAKSIFKGLADHALLKAWEFTLASFTEVRSNFSRWNLYSSLGLGPQDEGGIGACLYEFLKSKLDEANRQVQKLQDEYEIIYSQVKMLEARAKRPPSSESEASWTRAEYQSKVNEFHTFEEMRNKMHRRAEVFANLFDVLIDKYLKLFPIYYQEIYDPDMIQVEEQYDDSPAGFQLVFKHGRANTSQWSRIHSPQEYIQSLNAFFTAAEREIAIDPLFQGLEADISEITTRIVLHIKTERFLETAFDRMAIAQHTRPIKDPLNHLDKIEKKPWSYTSGGSMETLIGCYFKRPQKPTEETRWVENPTELLVYLIDVLKQMPPKITDEFRKYPNKSMLMHSPTHAFLLKPGYSGYDSSWETSAYTYIWVRDEQIRPMKRFVDHLVLDGEMIEFLLEKLIQKIPQDHHHFFRVAFRAHPRRLTPSEFRRYFLKTIHYDRNLRMNTKNSFSESDVDAFLFQFLPLLPVTSIKAKIEAIFEDFPLSPNQKQNLNIYLNRLIAALKPSPFISAKGLRSFCRILLCLALNSTSDSRNLPLLIDQTLQKMGLAMPRPVIFADSNWVKGLFAFLVNPATEEFELWLVNDHGTAGEPMISWNSWLNGTRRDRRWGVYTRPSEYTF